MICSPSNESYLPSPEKVIVTAIVVAVACTAIALLSQAALPPMIVASTVAGLSTIAFITVSIKIYCREEKLNRGTPPTVAAVVSVQMRPKTTVFHQRVSTVATPAPAPLERPPADAPALVVPEESEAESVLGQEESEVGSVLDQEESEAGSVLGQEEPEAEPVLDQIAANAPVPVHPEDVAAEAPALVVPEALAPVFLEEEAEAEPVLDQIAANAPVPVHPEDVAAEAPAVRAFSLLPFEERVMREGSQMVADFLTALCSSYHGSPHQQSADDIRVLTQVFLRFAARELSRQPPPTTASGGLAERRVHTTVELKSGLQMFCLVMEGVGLLSQKPFSEDLPNYFASFYCLSSLAELIDNGMLGDDWPFQSDVFRCEYVVNRERETPVELRVFRAPEVPQPGTQVRAELRGQDAEPIRAELRGQDAEPIRILRDKHPSITDIYLVEQQLKHREYFRVSRFDSDKSPMHFLKAFKRKTGASRSATIMGRTISRALEATFKQSVKRPFMAALWVGRKVFHSKLQTKIRERVAEYDAQALEDEGAAAADEGAAAAAPDRAELAGFFAKMNAKVEKAATELAASIDPTILRDEPDLVPTAERFITLFARVTFDLFLGDTTLRTKIQEMQIKFIDPFRERIVQAASLTEEQAFDELKNLFADLTAHFTPPARKGWFS